jgi:hypothetical protein
VSEIVPLAGTDEAAIAFNTLATGTLGNPDLKPERSSEWEVGLESQLLDGRFGLELNYFRKTSHDALVRRQVAPSAGSSPGRFENLGQVDNNGVEYKLSAQVLRRPNLDWNVSFGGSFLKNVLTSIGTDALGNTNPPVILGLASTQRHVEGYALGSYWQVPITAYADANGDGLLGPNEVTVGTTPVYLGNPFPKRELSFSSDVNLWKLAKLSALVDYKGGFQLLNLTRGQRCSTRDKSNCAELYDRNTPLDLQAASVARTQFASWAGFVEDADFVKLREIALTLSVPDRFARRVAAGGLHLTFAGRNLATWTKYTGLDPELNYGGQTNFNTADAGTLPPNRIYQIRIDAAF